MLNDSPEGSCPDFASVVRAALPVSSCSQGPGVRGQFLGVGTASGNYRPQRAAEQAFQATGSRSASHALIVVAFAPGDMRSGEGRMAAMANYQHMQEDSFVNVG